MFSNLLLDCLCLKVQSLNNEASRLAASYPGVQALEINSKQEEVETAWENLESRSMLRKSRLMASRELQTLNNSVRAKRKSD